MTRTKPKHTVMQRFSPMSDDGSPLWQSVLPLYLGLCREIATREIECVSLNNGNDRGDVKFERRILRQVLALKEFARSSLPERRHGVHENNLAKTVWLYLEDLLDLRSKVYRALVGRGGLINIWTEVKMVISSLKPDQLDLVKILYQNLGGTT